MLPTVVDADNRRPCRRSGTAWKQVRIFLAFGPSAHTAHTQPPPSGQSFGQAWPLLQVPHFETVDPAADEFAMSSCTGANVSASWSSSVGRGRGCRGHGGPRKLVRCLDLLRRLPSSVPGPTRSRFRRTSCETLVHHPILHHSRVKIAHPDYDSRVLDSFNEDRVGQIWRA